MDGGLILPPGLRVAGGGARDLDPLDSINRELVAFWPLDETNRVAAEDIAARRWRLTSPVWPTRVVERLGRATNFAAASAQYLENGSFVWPGGRSAAISVWIVPRSGFTGSPWNFGGNRPLVSGNAFYGHLPFSDNVAYFYYGGAGTGEINTSLAAHLDQWTHIAWSTSANRKAIWINGRLVNSSTSVPATAVAAGTGAFVGFSPVSGGYHQGPMRLLRLRAREWTDAEVQRLYRDPWAGTTAIAERLFYAVRLAGAPAELAAEITGTVDITASASAALALDATIAGTVDVTASVAATTTLDAEIAGTVPITADISARLDRLAEIAGTVPITASITAFMEGGAGDTHDGFLRRSRRQRALEAAERRRDAERLADARALRLELEAALGMAADAVEEAPAPAVEAVLEAVAVVRALPPVAPSVDFAAARAAVSDLLAAIEAARRAKELADDDEDVEILLRAL